MDLSMDIHIHGNPSKTRKNARQEAKLSLG